MFAMSSFANIAGLDAIAAADMPRREPAPVDGWSPTIEAPIDIRIDAEGRWFHEGERIRRAGLVALFASILRREPDGSHVLVTPAEKRFITVEDCAFVGVSVEVEGKGESQVVRVVTNLGDEIAIGPDHPLEMRESPVAGAGVKLAYVRVRGRLEARVGRAAFHDLAAAGCTMMHDGESWFGVWSSGRFWPMLATQEAGL
jgi:uncharacterized protein